MKIKLIFVCVMLCMNSITTVNGEEFSNYRTISISNDKNENSNPKDMKFYAVKEDESLYCIDDTDGQFVETKIMDDVKGVYYGKYVIKNDDSLWQLDNVSNNKTKNVLEESKKIADNVAVVNTNGYSTLIVKKDNTLWLLGDTFPIYTDYFSSKKTMINLLR